jgi:hypothetical protein
MKNTGLTTQTKLASLGLAKRLGQAGAAASMVVTLGVGSIEPAGLGLVASSGLAAIVATPAQARCLLDGAYRNDVADNDCLEAQRTGCVRHMLTPPQYTSCLAANKSAQVNGRVCIINGIIRNEFSTEDCQEAKATGCVRRLLSDAQYVSCLNAQHH